GILHVIVYLYILRLLYMLTERLDDTPSLSFCLLLFPRGYLSLSRAATGAKFSIYLSWTWI
ncbi:MAG TPA: hypothetical protein VJ761_22205, partial [Ktedonobacteraceae bacterium]|nr:hypothetical protein [Ktedonobacteraceae bacterium]